MCLGDKHLENAKQLALQINRRFKHVSFIVNKQGVVIGAGLNIRKTHPLAKEKGYLFNERHSELDAFVKVPKACRGESMRLINYRFNNQGELRMSKPCKLCMPWVVELFEEIWYSTNDGMVKL